MSESSREKLGRRLLPGTMNTVKAVDLLGPQEYAYLQNVRGYLQDRYVGRSPSSNAIYTLAGPPYSVRRLNDTTPAGPVAGYVRIIGAAGEMYVNATSVATGLTGNPVAINPFRPNASVQPWAYVGDSAPSPTVTIVSDSFTCSGMLKIRSDGLTRKQGIAEPQAAPTATFPGGGSGPSLIYYYYTYFASETGAESNPSPVSIPGTNAQDTDEVTLPATDHATNFTFNATQYQYVSPQIRTAGGVSPGTLTDYVTSFDYGFSVPDGSQVASVAGTGGSGMTPGTYALSFTGGGSPTISAAGTITVTSPTAYTITITNDGQGYSSPPTVTAATGGTPPILKATMTTPATITGIQIDLNWVGQNSGTGVLSTVSLFYLGSAYGTAKFPGIANQSFSSDTLQGSSGDTWGANISPSVINDSSFGFGVQITTQSVGGSDRSFINSMGMTIYYSTQNANITPSPSSDPQVDKINIYRQGGGLANPTYVLTVPNAAASYNDILSDLAASENPELQFDNYEPFPGIDLPQAGTLNASGQVLTWVSGGSVPSGSTGFNIRWLPGTVVLIGYPEQVAYSAVRRPSNNTTWDFTNNDVDVPQIPDGTNLVYNISEPTLAQQPLQSEWGPTDNSAYMFACYDPLRPGTLYYTKGNNPDAAPDTNQIEVCSSSETLMNGCIVNGIGMVFSTERAWLIYPTFTTALATVSGVEGQAFSLVESIANRGLYIRPCICTEAGQNVFFRAKDGIYMSPGGAGSQSLTDAQIYNLFPHEGMIPQPVVIGPYTVYPPDDTQPEKQKLAFATGYIYYDYIGTDSAPHTLVYDVAAKGWSVDVGNPVFTVHALEEGQKVNDTIVGCSDGTVRSLSSTGTEVVTSVVATGSVNSGDARAFKRIGDVFIKALVKVSNPITLALYANRYQTLLSGFSPTSLTGTGALLPYVIDFTSGLAQDVIDIASVFSWNTSSGNHLELWQPNWIGLPESTQDRPTDWDEAGGSGNKFFQGLVLECNTFGSAKNFSVEDDQSGLHTPLECPFTTASQTIRTFTFSPPFTSHMVRIVSTDGVKWQTGPSENWSIAWIFQPYPEQSSLWEIEATTFGNLGFQHLFAINLAYISANPVTLTITTDGYPSSFTMNFPAAGSGLTPAKIFVKAPANKWKIIQITATSSAPFSLWKNLVECWVGVWGRNDSYQKRQPTGGQSAIEGAEI